MPEEKKPSQPRSKKLVLKKETVKELNESDLDNVAGGVGITKAAGCTDSIKGPECQSGKCQTYGFGCKVSADAAGVDPCIHPITPETGGCNP